MSASISVYGIIPADEKFRQMKSIYDLCVEADVEIPEEVEKFFNYEEPDKNGLPIELDGERIGLDGERIGYHEVLIDLKKLPKSVKFIKCRIS